MSSPAPPSPEGTTPPRGSPTSLSCLTCGGAVAFVQTNSLMGQYRCVNPECDEYRSAAPALVGGMSLDNPFSDRAMLADALAALDTLLATVREWRDAKDALFKTPHDLTVWEAKDAAESRLRALVETP